MIPELLKLKEAADRAWGEARGRLNAAGPDGNKSVAAEEDYQRGRAAAFGEAIEIALAQAQRACSS